MRKITTTGRPTTEKWIKHYIAPLQPGEAMLLCKGLIPEGRFEISEGKCIEVKAGPGGEEVAKPFPAKEMKELVLHKFTCKEEAGKTVCKAK